MSAASSPETKLTSAQNIMKGIWGDGLSQQTGQAIMEGRECEARIARGSERRSESAI